VRAVGGGDGRAEPGHRVQPRCTIRGVKHSGLGREGGRVGIEEFLEIKYVAMNVAL
jgi:acyl-CoA reductase-like NAD-dependent aldehyde dehydrogenase